MIIDCCFHCRQAKEAELRRNAERATPDDSHQSNKSKVSTIFSTSASSGNVVCVRVVHSRGCS